MGRGRKGGEGRGADVPLNMKGKEKEFSPAFGNIKKNPKGSHRVIHSERGCSDTTEPHMDLPLGGYQECSSVVNPVVCGV